MFTLTGTANHIRVASNFVAGVTEHVNYASKRLARIEEVPDDGPALCGAEHPSPCH